MTNEEKYKQAFSVLHASEKISLEDNMNREKSFRPGRRLVTTCVCVAMMLALGVTAYAHGEEIINHIFGWDNNLEITETRDENGDVSSIAILKTDDLTDPVTISDGKMTFVVNDESIDITDQLSQEEAFRYEYDDEDSNTHIWFVGLNSDDPQNYGYAEYIKSPDGTWKGGYSTRVNIDVDGSTAARWLENAKVELNIPW